MTAEPVTRLSSDPASSLSVLRQEAERMEKRAAELRRVASDVHVARVVNRLREMLGDDKEIDLLRAALLVAYLDDEELDVADYERQVERMAEEVRKTFPENADEGAKLAALNKYLFEDNGFHGSRTEYYHKANSYLNRVLDDREGIPITLSVLYMELAKRLDLAILGIGLPGHFCVKHVAKDGAEQLIDVFEGGKKMSREDAVAKARESDVALRDEHLHPVTQRQIVQRMLRNLLTLAQEAKDRDAMLGYLEMLVALDPDGVQERGLRAVVKFETGRRDAAVADLDWFFDRRPEGLDLDRIREMQDYFRSRP